MTPNSAPRVYPSRNAIVAHWADRMIELGKVERYQLDDPEFSFCFACGWSWLLDEWKDKGNPLQRAHIVARCDGGSDDVDNLHMLCPECHKVSEYLVGDLYWSWLTERNIMDRILQMATMAGAINLSALLRGDFDAARISMERWNACQDQAAA